MRKLSLAVCILAGAAWAESGPDLFQKALVAERADGKLEEAIRLYQQVTQKFPQDRKLAAKALMQMGRCYEKLGKAQARNAYQQVVREYADQDEVVNAARAGLGRLGSVAEADRSDRLKLRHVQFAGGLEGIGGISPDGQYLSFVDGGIAMGDLSILDLATGQKRRVTKGASRNESAREGATSAVFSPDGKQIAYGWHVPSFHDELRIINLDGSGERTMYRSDRPVRILARGWSGGQIVILFGERNEKEVRVQAISAADGSVRTLKTYAENWPIAKPSPDGRWVALSHPANREYSLSLVSTADGREVSLLDSSKDSTEATAWTPDGKALLFTRLDNRERNLYRLQIQDGRAVGQPALVRRDVPSLNAIGMTRLGSLYYLTGAQTDNIFTAELDPETARMQSAPVLATSLSIGENSYSSWSPDGSRLAYITGRRVAIMDLAGGAVRELTPLLASFNKLQWHRDQKAIMTYAVAPEGKQGIFLIDVQSGAVTPLALRESADTALHNPVWTVDGKSILYRRSDGRGNGFEGGTYPVAVLLKNLETGRTRELFSSASPRPSTLAVSPDGSEAAFLIGKAIMAVPLAGGQPRTILRLKPEESFQSVGGLVWMPNGKRLLFLKQITNSVYPSTQVPVTVWSVRADGGESESTGITMPGISELSVHPDGRRIGFDAASSGSKPDTWVLEGFSGLL